MNDFFGWSGVVGTIFGLIGMIYAIKAWSKSVEVEKFLEREKARLSKRINLVLTDGEKTHYLPNLRRQDVTRNEIQGRLGAIPIANPIEKKSNRYSIELSPEFYEQIDSIAAGTGETEGSTLTIKCTPEEFAQFNFESALTKETKEKKTEVSKPERKARTRKIKVSK